MQKPGIIVISEDDEDTFRWVSDGWNEMKQSHTKKARDLMTKANEAIDAAKDVPDAIDKLKDAGFSVRRDETVRKMAENIFPVE